MEAGPRRGGPRAGAGRDWGQHLGEVAPPRPLALPCAAAREREAADLESLERPPAFARRAEARVVTHRPPGPSGSGAHRPLLRERSREPRREPDPSHRDPWRLALRPEICWGLAQVRAQAYFWWCLCGSGGLGSQD